MQSDTAAPSSFVEEGAMPASLVELTAHLVALKQDTDTELQQSRKSAVFDFSPSEIVEVVIADCSAISEYLCHFMHSVQLCVASCNLWDR